jgi:hypothetical protein
MFVMMMMVVMTWTSRSLAEAIPDADSRIAKTQRLEEAHRMPGVSSTGTNLANIPDLPEEELKDNAVCCCCWEYLLQW